MTKRTLFHGTAHRFDAFDDRFVSRGCEPNSALGIHLTEHPDLAAEYAELATRDANSGSPTVLRVVVDVNRVAVVTDRVEFLGREDEEDVRRGTRHSEFVAMRHELESAGFDAIAGEGLGSDLEGVWVVFDPLRTTIVGTMTVAEANELAEVGLAEPDEAEPSYVGVSLRDIPEPARRRPAG